MALIRRNAQPAPEQLYGVSVVRVSEQGKRADNRFISPLEQQRRIDAQAEKDGVVIKHRYDEIDVSGKRLLTKRPGMRRAVEHVEAREAEVIYIAYFDRIARNNKVRGEIVDRVEAMGAHCSVYAVGFGAISHRTSIARVTSNLLGILDEFYAMQIGEKTEAARQIAIENGICIFPRIPLGYRKDPDTRRLIVVPDEAKLVVECFEKRRDGVSIKAIRGYLREHGIERTHRQVATMFGLRLYLGEVHLGDLVNDDAHAAIIVDPVLFEQAGEVKEKRGRTPRAPRLLSKLDLLFCGTCEAVLYSGMRQLKGKYWYPLYRCANLEGECKYGVTISAEQLEAIVIARATEKLAEIPPRGVYAEDEIDAATHYRDRARAELAAAVASFKGIDADVTGPKLKELQAEVKAADERLGRLRAAAGPLAQVRGADWFSPDFDDDDRRAMLRGLFARILVLPGKRGQKVVPVERVRFEDSE